MCVWVVYKNKIDGKNINGMYGMNSVNSLQLSQNSSFMGIAIMWSDTILTCLPSSSPSLLKSQIPIHKLIMKSLSIQSYTFFCCRVVTHEAYGAKERTNDRLSCHNWISLHSITTQSHHKILRENQIIAWNHTHTKNIEANSCVRQT